MGQEAVVAGWQTISSNWPAGNEKHDDKSQYKWSLSEPGFETVVPLTQISQIARQDINSVTNSLFLKSLREFFLKFSYISLFRIICPYSVSTFVSSSLPG